MKKILFASLNRGKCEEACEFLSKAGVAAVSALDLKGPPPAVEESGSTYEENARLKAKAFFDWSKIESVADDSGLEVAALGGGPGVLSARFAGGNASSDANKAKLLQVLAGVGAEGRSARFVCCLCLWSEGGEKFFWGELRGRIAEAETGSGGFGYDPVFVPEGESESLASLKSRNPHYPTHRTRALAALVKYLEDR